ncbi:MAG TPA: LysM peptidoglycan-binding domain-containing protein [Verrucomicrobiales bacterium]|nr:LysM peptidoglycan-binding domain-containing protein [Verrucomicrobiales bacterium]
MTLQAAARALFLVALPLVLSHCASKPAYKAASYSPDRLATIPSNMPRGDYPFDDQGRYRTDWVGGGRSKKSSRTSSSTTRKPTSVASNQTSPPRPTSQAPVAATPKPAPKPATRYHTVVKGDTLSGLSRKYGVTIAELKKTNGLSSDLIKLGQSLRIP